MRKAMRFVAASNPSLFFSIFPPLPRRRLPFSTFSAASSTAFSASSPSASRNPFVFNYLINSFGFSETKALSALKNLPRVLTPDRPEAAVRLLRQHGFSDDHILKTVHSRPQILFSNIDRVILPKLKFFEDLGLCGPHLGLFISKYSSLLTCSLDKKLAPSVSILRKFLSGQDLLRIVKGCSWIVHNDPNSTLVPNIDFLRNHCRIDSSQLMMLLKKQPRVFAMKQSALRGLVQDITEMGFSVDSRMFVYVVQSFNSVSPKLLERKMELFYEYGFSKEELMLLLRRSPKLLTTSEEKLRLGLEFFVNQIGAGISTILHHPACLMYSMEKRVAPRYMILLILKSKKLLKKDSKITSLIKLSEDKFLKRYILRFETIASELLNEYEPDAPIASK